MIRDPVTSRLVSAIRCATEGNYRDMLVYYVLAYKESVEAIKREPHLRDDITRQMNRVQYKIAGILEKKLER